MAWYAFRTESQKEFPTQEILCRRGFDAYVPHEERVIRSRGARRKSTLKTYPMVVGYVFVRFSHPPNWYRMFSMHCLKSVVGFGGQPTPIPEDDMNRVLAMRGQSVPHTLSRNTRRAFVPGDDVRVADGPLMGFEGRVESVHGAKARMFFEMLGALREIDVPIETLEAA